MNVAILGISRRVFRRALVVLAVLALGALAVGPGTQPARANGSLSGVDVSAHQGSIDWGQVRAAGNSFAYLKATEGTSYRNPQFATDYANSAAAGLIRGAAHVAIPGTSSGATQADFFVNHGGGWSRDHQTLPGALDIEYNPYGAACYGLSRSAMVDWIRSFVDRYHSRTGRWVVVYTTTGWWQTCTGDYSGFSADCPLWIAAPPSGSGILPGGWPFWTFWQYGDGPVPGSPQDLGLDTFNGGRDQLLALADNTL